MGVVVKSARENTINMPFREPQNSIIMPLPNGRDPKVKFQEKGRGHFLESQSQGQVGRWLDPKVKSIIWKMCQNPHILY